MGRQYLDAYLAKSEKARKSAGYRWSDANAMLPIPKILLGKNDWL